MEQQPGERRIERLQRQIRQLILLRETGPKSAAWHAARARLIWRLQEELHHVETGPTAGESRAPDADG